MRRYDYSMGQIYSTRPTDSLKNRSSLKNILFFWNRSSDKSFYVIELNLFFFFFLKLNFSLEP